MTFFAQLAVAAAPIKKEKREWRKNLRLRRQLGRPAQLSGDPEFRIIWFKRENRDFFHGKGLNFGTKSCIKVTKK